MLLGTVACNAFISRVVGGRVWRKIGEMTFERGHHSTTRKSCHITYLPQIKTLVPWERNIAAVILNRRPSPWAVGRPVQSWHWTVLNLPFPSPFINQHSCTTLCILNHMSVACPTRFGVCWHHIQGDQSKCKFFATPNDYKHLNRRPVRDRSLF